MQTQKGAKRIEEIEVGDEVESWDLDTASPQVGFVADTFVTQYDGEMVDIRLEDEEITATAGHPFWVVRGEALENRPLVAELIGEPGGVDAPALVDKYTSTAVLANCQTSLGRWVSAVDLQAGDVLWDSFGERPILAVETGRDRLAVYNFHVEKWSNYAVGEAGVLVHNTSVPTGCQVDKSNTCHPKVRSMLGRYKKLEDKLKDCPEDKKKAILETCCYAAQALAKAPNDSSKLKAAQKACPKDPSCCDESHRYTKAPCAGYSLSPGESKIVSRDTVTVKYGEPIRHFDFIVVREVVANLKYFGSSRSREPDTFMRTLIKYGLLIYPGTTLGLESDDVGHAIGNQFGGYANKSQGNGNVFAQNYSTNRGQVSSFETNTLAAELQKASTCEICVRLSFKFDSSSKTYFRPTGYEYDWWLNGVPKQGKSFDNPGY